MKILVYTGFNDDRGYKETGLISAPNKALYAYKHGYDFLCKRNYDGYERPISWFKIKHILELLPKYDYIFWSDADAIITNYQIKIEDIITSQVERPLQVNISPGPVPILVDLPKMEEQNYFIAYDNYSPCMGHFIIKNCEWSIKFFEEIYAQTQFMNDPIWDNRGQGHLFHKFPDYMSKVKFLPKHMINSMMPDWKDGDFLIHFPATEMPRRIIKMAEYSKKIIY
jgi:hypothetical protein